MQPTSAHLSSTQNTYFNSSHRYNMISTQNATREARREIGCWRDTLPLKAGSWESSQNQKIRLNIADTFTSTIFLLRCKFSTRVSSFSLPKKRETGVLDTALSLVGDRHPIHTPCAVPMSCSTSWVCVSSDWRLTKVCHRGLNLKPCLNISHK